MNQNNRANQQKLLVVLAFRLASCLPAFRVTGGVFFFSLWRALVPLIIVSLQRLILNFLLSKKNQQELPIINQSILISEPNKYGLLCSFGPPKSLDPTLLFSIKYYLPCAQVHIDITLKKLNTVIFYSRIDGPWVPVGEVGEGGIAELVSG